MWNIAASVTHEIECNADRRCQLEFVQGENDWHVHLGIYPPGDTEHPNRLILAMD
jgi:hypothetical protein